MFFARYRKFVVFIDPFTLSDKFLEANSLAGLLEIWQKQSKVFQLREHGPAFIQSLKKFEKSELEYSLLDKRYFEFLKTIESERSRDTFLTTCIELADISNSINSAFDINLVNKFSSLLLNFSSWSLSQQCKGLQLFSKLQKSQIKKYPETLNQLFESLSESIESSLPTTEDLQRLLASFKALDSPNLHLLYILEPYILRDLKKFSNSSIIDIYTTYSALTQGTKDFIQQLNLHLLVISDQLNAEQLSGILSHSYRFNASKIFGFADCMMLYIRDIMKKMKSFTSNDLKTVTSTLYFARQGNKHYYEILGISFVKHAKELNEQELINCVYAMAMTGISSVVSAKTLTALLTPMVLSQASTIQGHLTVEKVSPIGLLTHADYENFHIDQVKHMLFPQFKKQSKLAKPVQIKEVFETTAHSFYSFPQMIKLLWSYLVIAENSSIETIDGTVLNLMVRLVERQLAEINKNGDNVTPNQHEMILQVSEIIAKYFKTIKNLQVPKAFLDFTCHADEDIDWFVSEEEKEEDEEFLIALEKFCQEHFLKCFLYGAKENFKFDASFVVAGYVANIPGKVPAIVVRNFECFKNGELSERTKIKVRSMGNVAVLKASEWGKIKNDTYFEEILELRDYVS